MMQLKFNFLVKVLWPDIVITVSWCEQRAEGSEAVFKVELFFLIYNHALPATWNTSTSRPQERAVVEKER